jgi:cellulase
MQIFKVLAIHSLVIATVYGHAHITNWNVGGSNVQGFEFWQFKNSQKLNSSWYSENGDNGFVAAQAIGSPDIICHKAGRPGSTHTRVAAGISLTPTTRGA